MSEHLVGYSVLRTEDQARGRPILIDAWYPADPAATESEHTYGLGHGRVAAGAGPAGGPHAVILLSPGAYGSARNYSWIAEHLARRGYVIVGVSHYGESYLYGTETIDPVAAVHPERRPPDCTFALDHLLGTPPFRDVADPARIGAIGHSSGGATVLELGGAEFEPRAMARYCASGAARDDRGCAYARGAIATPDQEPTPGAAFRNSRVGAIVALDPALGPGHGEQSLAAMTVPVLVIGATHNDFLPFEHHAGRYARLIPGASLMTLSNGEGHFVYLDECDADLDANGVPLCRDREGLDRSEVHARLKGIIAAFFDQHLGAP